MDAPTVETRKYGDVAAIDAAATFDGERQELAVFLVNRSATESADTTLDLGSWPAAHVAEAVVIGGGDAWETNTREQPDRVVPRPLGGIDAVHGEVRVSLPGGSWSMIRLGVETNG